MTWTDSLPKMSDSGWETFAVDSVVAAVLWVVARYGARLAQRLTQEHAYLQELLAIVDHPETIPNPAVATSSSPQRGSAPEQQLPV